jgi:thioredoxin-like negative regulator of GroEL
MLARSVLHHRLPAVFRASRPLSNYIVLEDDKIMKAIIASDASKILYFTATWCPPCRKIKPMFEKMALEYTSTTFVQIDIDDHPDIASAHNVSSVPTFKAIAGKIVIAEVRCDAVSYVICA